MDGSKPADRRKLAGLSDDDPVWDATAYYLAGICVSLILVASPERIVFGGGVMKRACLFPKIRAEVLSQLNGYLSVEALTPGKIDEYIVPSVYGDDAGLIGAGLNSGSHMIPKDSKGFRINSK